MEYETSPLLETRNPMHANYRGKHTSTAQYRKIRHFLKCMMANIGILIGIASKQFPFQNLFIMTIF